RSGNPNTAQDEGAAAQSGTITVGTFGIRQAQRTRPRDNQTTSGGDGTVDRQGTVIGNDDRLCTSCVQVADRDGVAVGGGKPSPRTGDHPGYDTQVGVGPCLTLDGEAVADDQQRIDGVGGYQRGEGDSRVDQHVVRNQVAARGR